ncbi:MAG: hypothetical protein AB7K64_12435 [Variibacter sp.]
MSTESRRHDATNKEETWIDTPPSSPHDMTKAAIAEALGVSLPMLYVIYKDGTASRERAQKLADIHGKPIERFLRQGRTRGRPRAALPFPFEDFCKEAADLSEFEAAPPDPLVAGLYSRFRYAKPREIEGVAALVAWLREVDNKVQIRDVQTVWRAFQAWRIEKAATALTDIIANGDALSDDAMRSMLNLVGRLERDDEWDRARF